MGSHGESLGVLRESVDWLLGVLAGDVAADVVEAGFAPRMTEGRDLAGGLAKRFASFRGAAAKVASFEVLSPTRARAVVVCGGREWEFTVAVESAAPHRIAAFQPRAVPEDAVAWADVVEPLRELDYASSELPEAVAERFRVLLVEAAAADRVVGLCCGVVVDGEVVYQGYLGAADVRTFARVDHASVFRVGSVTKLVTACAVLDAVEEGMLELGAPLSEFVAGGGGATVEDLLLHRAGLPRDFPGRRGEVSAPGSLGEVVEMLPSWPSWPSVSSVPPVPPAGGRGEYSNVGYEVLGLLVEQVTGEDFAGRCSRRVLDRFAMGRGARLGGAGAVAPSTMVGYEVVAGKVAPVAEAVEGYRFAGGMTSDIAGILALAASIGRDSLAKGLMGYRAPAGPGAEFVPGGTVFARPEGPVFWRGGSTRGFTAEIVAALDGSAGVVVLGAATPAGGLRAVAEGLLGEVRGLRDGVS